MRRYASFGEQNVPGTAGSGQVLATVMTITSATTVRPHLYFLTFGCSGTPSDQAYTMNLGRITADTSTATSGTFVAIDPGDPAALAGGGSYKYKHTALGPPTYTAGATLLSVDLNQRASFSWIEDPDRGIVLPATASYGVGLYFAVITGGTPLCHATMHHAE